jgi:hydrogenase expression/formation protein
VLELLEKVGVDYLGVSLDALLIYCSEGVTEQIIKDLAAVNVKCAEIGYVDDSDQVNMVFEGEEKQSILPKFRESAYTKIKQELGENTPDAIQEMERKIEKAASEALKKRQAIISYIKN